MNAASDLPQGAVRVTIAPFGDHGLFTIEEIDGTHPPLLVLLPAREVARLVNDGQQILAEMRGTPTPR